MTYVLLGVNRQQVGAFHGEVKLHYFTSRSWYLTNNMKHNKQMVNGKSIVAWEFSQVADALQLFRRNNTLQCVDPIVAYDC